MKPARTTLLKVLVAVALVTPAAFSAEPRAVTWAQQRKDRDAQIERHLETAKDGYRWFASAAHGKEAGIPLVLLRLLPELAPDVWGEPKERLAKFGFFDTPDTVGRPLPLGMG